MLFTSGTESDWNINCSSLAWSASCSTSSYLRRLDKHNAVTGKTHEASASEMYIKICHYTTR